MIGNASPLWLLATVSGLAGTAAASCEPELAFHPPKYRDGDLRNAFAHIKGRIESAFSAGEYNDTSVSVEIASSTDTLFSYHHTASVRPPGGAPRVDGSTAYRVASTTKLLTALGIFQQEKAGKLRLDDPVSEYVAGLPGRDIDWERVTVRRLIAHLSGIRNDYSDNDFFTKLPDPTVIGLPPISPAEEAALPRCGSFTSDKAPCTEQDLLESLETSRLVFPPDTAVSYSNTGYDLLGLVLSNVTGLSYEDYIASSILEPLGMDNTSFETPDEARSVVVRNSDWGVDHGSGNAAGGLYSTTSDMIRFLQFALRSHGNVSATTDWFLPTAYSPGSHSAMGYPWEIFRTTASSSSKPASSSSSSSSSSGRAVTVLTKGGGLDGYYSYSVVIPAYDIVVFMAAGGQLPLLNAAFAAVREELAAAAEAVAQEQLAAGYAGTYAVVHDDESTRANSSLVLGHDAGKSLFVEGWVSNSTDVLAALTPLVAAQAGTAAEDLYFQVIPTFRTRDDGEGGRVGEVWRFINVLSDEGKNKKKNGNDTASGNEWGDYCIGNIDPLKYAGLPLNELVFWRGGGGKEGGEGVDAVELTAFNITLVRT